MRHAARQELERRRSLKRSIRLADRAIACLRTDRGGDLGPGERAPRRLLEDVRRGFSVQLEEVRG